MPTVPTTELGHVANTGWAGRSTFGYPLDEAEESAAWQWPTAITTADRMSRHPQVQAVWWALTLPMRRDIWAIDPQQADPARVDMLADDLDLPILDEKGERRRRPKPRRKGRFSWPEHLRLALLHLRWGCMFFEPVYDAVALEQTGQARLRKLAPRFPRTLSHIDVEADGGLKAIRQWTTGPGAKEISIPVARLVAYVHNREGANWHGQSIFRAMYRPFELADRSERVEAMTGERNGMGVPQAVYTGPHPESQTQAQIDAANDAAQAWRAGDYSAAAMPPGWRIHLTGVEGTLPDLDKPITRHHALMAKSVQAMFMELGTTASGHRALGETFVDFFAAAVGGIADGIADVTTQHVVEDWWDLNFGPDDPAPAVVSAPIDAETDIPPESLVALVNAKVITPDADIEAWLRTRYRLPAAVLESPGIPTQGPDSNAEATEIAARTNAAGLLIRSGFDAQAALAAVGLPPIAHTGLLPVTLQSEQAAEAVPSGVVAAARRIAAAEASTWAERFVADLAALVDVDAIVAAVADGETAEAAVDAAMAGGVGDLPATLGELWAEAYSDGETEARSRVNATARRVRAGLADLTTRALDASRGIVSTLRDRLVKATAKAVASGLQSDALRLALNAIATDPDHASVIAQTEQRRAMVTAAADVYAAAGITRTRWVRRSGSGDSDECEALDGSESDSWDELPPLHPNCSCRLEPAG